MAHGQGTLVILLSAPEHNPPGCGRKMLFSVWMDSSWVHVCADEKPAEGRQVEVRKRRSLQGRREEVGGLSGWSTVTCGNLSPHQTHDELWALDGATAKLPVLC